MMLIHFLELTGRWKEKTSFYRLSPDLHTYIPWLMRTPIHTHTKKIHCFRGSHMQIVCLFLKPNLIFHERRKFHACIQMKWSFGVWTCVLEGEKHQPIDHLHLEFLWSFGGWQKDTELFLEPPRPPVVSRRLQLEQQAPWLFPLRAQAQGDSISQTFSRLPPVFRLERFQSSSHCRDIQ